jgi:hypothetical protein
MVHAASAAPLKRPASPSLQTPDIKRVKGAYTPLTPPTTLFRIPNTYYQMLDTYYTPQMPGDYMPPVMHVPGASLDLIAHTRNNLPSSSSSTSPRN